MYHSIISLASYKPRDLWYRGTKVCMGTYRFVEKPGTTDEQRTTQHLPVFHATCLFLIFHLGLELLNYRNVRVSETESKLIKALIVYVSNSFLPSIPVSLRWIRLRVSLCRQCCSLFSMERRRSIQW